MFENARRSITPMAVLEVFRQPRPGGEHRHLDLAETVR
jgi:hypothetical protein